MTAHHLAKQYRLNGIHYRWLHEEIRNHPIRNGEYTTDSLHSEAGMERNIQDMFDRWERLIQRVLRSKCIYILEAVLIDICHWAEGSVDRTVLAREPLRSPGRFHPPRPCGAAVVRASPV